MSSFFFWTLKVILFRFCVVDLIEMSRRGSRSKKTFELVRQGDEEEFHTSKRSKETLSLPPRRPKKQNLYVEAAKGGSLDPDDDGDEDFAVGPAGRKAGSARKMNAGGWRSSTLCYLMPFVGKVIFAA